MFKVETATGGPLPPPAPTPPPTRSPASGDASGVETWFGPYATPVVGVAMANLPEGKILIWSAYLRAFLDYDDKMTWTAIYDPVTDHLSEKLVVETNHDM